MNQTTKATTITTPRTTSHFILIDFLAGAPAAAGAGTGGVGSAGGVGPGMGQSQILPGSAKRWPLALGQVLNNILY